MKRSVGTSETCNQDESRRHLLLDDSIVEGTSNAELTLGIVKKHGVNPLFGEDRPWERRFDNLYANVIFDEEEQFYKVWYSPFIVDRSAKGMSTKQWQETKYQAPFDREMAICYATSTDGLKWTKPELGFVEYEQSRTNNILWRGSGDTRSKRAGPHGAGIFKDDLDPDPERRYKALLKWESLAVAFSRDGVHWDSPITCSAANSAGDTHNNAFWAPTLGKYVGITRQWSPSFQRQVARTSSDDFVTWQETKVVLEGLDERHQTYAMPVFFHGGVYIGLLAIHDQDSDRVWTELTWSPDTTTWHRVLPGTAFIPNGRSEGDYDWGCVFAAACPIFLEDEIRIYYGGNDGLHTSWRNGYFCLATLRPDGFAGYKQKDSNTHAIVTTTPLFCRDDVLLVSADVEMGGELVLRILGDERQVLTESEPLSSTVTNKEIRWRNPRVLTVKNPKPVQLQFAFRRATIYSFRLISREEG
ncbi:MAG: hypothetical protein OXG15_08705 [Gammaproteobacteria bacterium]|nr:hypothetical protein [Gammaproteobacteria bacterium]